MVAKKTKKVEKIEECCCEDPSCLNTVERPPMSGMCYAIGGILAMFAGVVFLLGAFGSVDTMTVYIAAGILLVFHGLGGVLHVIRGCPMCKPK
ncbi:MAG: hypothetical protein ABH842_05930 [Candidatus Micrarchaeota archaeon]